MLTVLIYYFTDVRWLKSATITLLSDNKTVSVVCDINESSPPVECRVVVDCMTCKSVPTEVFVTRRTEVKVTPGNDYYISVQAVATDTEKPLENYSVAKTLSVPSSSPSNGSSSKFMIFVSQCIIPIEVSKYAHNLGCYCV